MLDDFVTYKDAFNCFITGVKVVEHMVVTVYVINPIGRCCMTTTHTHLSGVRRDDLGAYFLVILSSFQKIRS